ncbi:helix-turn-helix transcriptional regulator [Brevundimonas sp.]|uniref:helix-turn-helix domain-containing protein n=1 Tax=Brevundimonas sp. TaxID=1871086 RepID=UPI0028970E9D|nr:helix-turn-helix transcriptional regulator [Brevundimonas sp.]
MSKAGDEEELDRKRTRHIDGPLGVRLRAMREDRGLTQAEMAHKLGISANQWGRHEAGENRVPAARLWQFCRAMNVTVAEIYDGLPSNIVLQQGQAGMGEQGETPFEGAPPIGQPLVQRIGAAARKLPEARQRTALAVIRALKDEGDR